jgi:hypothetical protein
MRVELRDLYLDLQVCRMALWLIGQLNEVTIRNHLRHYLVPMERRILQRLAALLPPGVEMQLGDRVIAFRDGHLVERIDGIPF